MHVYTKQNIIVNASTYYYNFHEDNSLNGMNNNPKLPNFKLFSETNKHMNDLQKIRNCGETSYLQLIETLPTGFRLISKTG